MRRKTWILGGLAAALVLGGLGWAFAPRPAEVEVARAAWGRFERTLEEDGKTRVVDRYVVGAPLSGRLLRPALREGDEVQAGQVLLRLAPVLPALLDARTVAEQGERLQAAEAGVQRAAAGVAGARVGVEQARLAFQRSESLARQGFVSPTQLDNERLALAAAQQALAAAEAAAQVARHERETARAALAAVRSPSAGSGAGFEVRAPVAGRVLRLAQSSEAVVSLGTALVELGDTRRLEVVAELLTSDALQAAPGAPVRIERWGGPQPLQGVVQRVEPGGYTKVSALGVEEQRTKVVVGLQGEPGRWAALGDGYRVAVSVVVQAQDRALMVPVSAVFPRPGAAPGEMAVFRLEDGHARLVPVRLGGRNGAAAWVSEGLAEGETVIVYPGSGLADGARVRPRRV